MKPVEATAVGFASYVQPADVVAKGQDRTFPAPADGKLLALAEKFREVGGDTEKLKSDCFTVRPDGVPVPAGDDPAKPLAWYPLLVAGTDGRVTLGGFSPVAGKTYRLLIDAQGDGRVESCELLWYKGLFRDRSFAIAY